MSRPFTCGMRAAGVPLRTEYGKTCNHVRLPSRTSAKEFSKCASVSVGNPAIISAPKVISGRRRNASSVNLMASSRKCRRFMRFKIRSSPCCRDRCKCGIKRGSVAMACINAESTSIESIELIRRRGKSGTSFRIRSTKSPKRGVAGKSAPQLVISTPVSTISA